MIVSRLLGGAAMAAVALATAAPARAQDHEPAMPAAGVSEEQVEQSSSDILVTANIGMRNRTDDANPVLSYDLDYFQRFEPVSVGEMLKRVPGVTFTSDVLEYDQAQFRGLPPGYTQVLINGRRAPGSSADRSFFVDRIPAELVERIEIVRAPRADQPSEGSAGTLNIVTKEATSFEGGFAKAGALINADGKVRPSGALAYAGKLGERTDYWFAVNYQERRNPKKKISYRFGDTPAKLDTDERGYVSDPEFDDLERQDDTRDGSDLSGSAEISTELAGGGRFRINGFFVDTDRTETEVSRTYKGSTLKYVEIANQLEDISQQTYAASADLNVPLGAIELGAALGWSGYREDSVSTETKQKFPASAKTEVSRIDINDDEYTGTLYVAHDAEWVRAKLGMDVLSKHRDGLNDGDLLSESFKIDEERYDPYLRLTFDIGSAWTIDAGLRYQTTSRRVIGARSVSYNDQQANPSLHLRWSPTATDQFRASFARTVRRPGYDFISPFTQDETPGDDDVTRGNPGLRNEDSVGIDVGYERRLAGNGIVGVNFFYRDVSDLIELVVTGANGSGQSFTPRNIGDGKTWGAEIDFSMPVKLFGFGQTGLFANYTYLDSETIDPFTREKRRFNNQPHHVYNAGFIQNVDPVDMSFGATVSGRSEAFESNFDEVIWLRYEPDLEAFVEKRIGKNFVLRASVQNILDRQKKEDFRKFDGDSLTEILADRRAGKLDEYEIEREQAGQLFQVTLRAAF